MVICILRTWDINPFITADWLGKAIYLHTVPKIHFLAMKSNEWKAGEFDYFSHCEIYFLTTLKSVLFYLQSKMLKTLIITEFFMDRKLTFFPFSRNSLRQVHVFLRAQEWTSSLRNWIYPFLFSQELNLPEKAGKLSSQELNFPVFSGKFSSWLNKNG